MNRIHGHHISPSKFLCNNSIGKLCQEPFSERAKKTLRAILVFMKDIVRNETRLIKPLLKLFTYYYFQKGLVNHLGLTFTMPTFCFMSRTCFKILN